MKVAFLTAKPNPDNLINNHRFAVDERRHPTGIGYLYACLRQDKIYASIYDRYCGDDYWPYDDFESYDFVGIYCSSICTEDISWMISKLKSKIIAVGGPHASLYPEWFPEKVLYIVQGEAEYLIRDIINGNIDSRIIKPQRLTNEDLDNLPRFPWEVFYKDRHNYLKTFPFSTITPIFTFNTSRACVYNCSFCSTRKIWGRKYTYMSADRIFDDMEYVRSLGSSGVYFREDNFTIHRERVIALCEKLLRNKPYLIWACETRADLVDEEMISLMRRAGCIGFYIGVESLSQHMLNIFNKDISVDRIVKTFELCHKYHVKTAASFIVGHPEETVADVIENKRVLDIVRPTLIWRNEFRAEG